MHIPQVLTKLDSE